MPLADGARLQGGNGACLRHSPDRGPVAAAGFGVVLRAQRKRDPGRVFPPGGAHGLQNRAQLIEHIDVQERIAAALEYNAAAMTRFWERMAAGESGPDPVI